MRNPFKRRKFDQSGSTVESKEVSTSHEEIKSSDLPIALYLNQRMTFDVLASLDGGFSHFTTIQTTSTGESSTEMSGGAKLGVSNPFALLGVEFGGSRQKGQGQSESATMEIVHTPASLFARLRRDLRVRGLVRDVSNPSDIISIQPGEFVEFEATLRKNPFAEILDSFSELLPLMKFANAGTHRPAEQDNKRKGRRLGKDKPKRDEFSDIADLFSLLKATFTADGSQDLIAEIGLSRLVLTVDQEYFIDPTMNDTIDGTFRVFGKATRVVSDCDREISLLRRTPLGKFENLKDVIAPMMEGIRESGFIGSVETEISGPTMQVIPIAIFS